METQTKAAIVTAVAAIIVAAMQHFGPMDVPGKATVDVTGKDNYSEEKTNNSINVNVNQIVKNNNTNIITN